MKWKAATPPACKFFASLSFRFIGADNLTRELASHFASSFLAQTNPLYIYIYATADQVPYKQDTEVLTASGSFGIVYKGIDANTGTVHAIKQLRKIYIAKKRNEVLKELGMLERCDHPNIIRLLDAYQIDDDPGTVSFVTEPWAPYTLSSFLHDNDSQRRAAYPWFIQDSPLTERHIFRIFDGLADGLEYLHSKSIKHKDIKPENILLYFAGQETPCPIIADLGISKIFHVDNPTDYNKSTYTYLAPEQIDCIESTLKADVWQMGCCFALILAVFRAGAAGCRELWTSFENSDGYCSCNIAKESHSFMKSLKKICGSGTPSQCHAHWIITAMLETIPTARFDIKAVRREVLELLSVS